MSEIDLLAIGNPVPPDTKAALGDADIVVHDWVADCAHLEEKDRQPVDVVLAIPSEGDLTSVVADIRDRVPNIPVVLVDPGEDIPSDSLLEPGTIDYIRQTDLQNHGELVAHRIRSVFATAQRDDEGEVVDGLQNQLERAANTLTATAETTTATELDPTEKLGRLVSIGAEELGFPIGYVTKIESETQKILAATGDHEAIQPGKTDPLGQTYCRKTIDNDEPIVLEDAPEEGWADDPAYERFGLRCYVGARIVVDGEVYGTVCFADQQSRDGLEGAVYQSTVKALAQCIGYEIERHQYEAELEDREERLRALFEHAPDGIVIHNEEGTVSDVNETLVENLGYGREELLSMNVADFEVGFDQGALLEAWEEMDEHRPLVVEGTHRRKDGSTYPVEVWVSRINHSEGSQFIAICRDVTDRRQREIHLEKAQEVANIGWWRKDIPSDQIYWSERVYEMWGAEGEVGLVDHEVFMEFIHPEDEDFVEEAWEAAKEGAPYDIEHRIVTGDGETRWMREKAELTFDEDGRPTSAVGIVQDVTDRKKRERELERHRAYLESANDMITLIDPNGTIEYVSPAIERVLGWEPEELIGENGFEYVHPEDRDDRIEDIEAFVEGTEDESVLEFRFQCADGSYCWIEATARDLLDDPDISGLLLSSRDVTDRKEHERQITALHDATRDLIDAESKADVAAIAVEAASELLDFSLPSVWYPEDDELVLVANSEDHQHLLEEAGTPDPSHPRGRWIWDVFEGGETVVKSPIAQEELAADVPLQSVIVLPIGSHGIFACAATGTVDFTDRQVRVAETLAQNVRVALDQLDQRNALKRQKEFVDDLLDAIEDVVYVLDTDGDLQMWNAAFEEVTGYETDEIASMNATEFFAGDNAEAAAAAVEEAFETGRTRVELDFKTKDGKAIPYEFIANAFEDSDGEPVMAGTGRDRSLHVEYEQRLQEQRDRLDLLNQVVRHDVRNDMQVVHGRAHILENHVEEEGEEHLREVIHATEEAIELTKTARDLTETMLREEEELKPISLDRELSSQLEEIRSQHDSAVIRTDGRLPPVDVQADEMLEAVFRNLLQNAIVHNDKEIPEISVSADVHDETVHVHIADNGPGIPDSQKEDVFGKGEKGLDSPGTGLGLYLVKTLVENYGGEVWVEDNDPEGAVFVVALPVTE